MIRIILQVNMGIKMCHEYIIWISIICNLNYHSNTMLEDEYQDCSSIHYDENDDDTNTFLAKPTP